MRVLNFFMFTGLSFYLHISASPLKDSPERDTKNTISDIDLRIFQSPNNKNSRPSIVSSKEPQIYGFNCRDKFYPISYMKRIAGLGAQKLRATGIQQYPMRFKPGLYIYPILPDQKTSWAQGQPEGLDRVVLDAHGNAFYAVTLSDHPGFTVESSYQSCDRVEKSLPHLSGESSLFTRFGSANSPWKPKNPPSAVHGVNNHFGNNARNPPIHVK